jgi:hypothetical protein
MNRILRIIIKYGLGMFGILCFLTFLMALFISPIGSMPFLVVSIVCFGILSVWDRRVANNFKRMFSQIGRGTGNVLKTIAEKDRERYDRARYEDQLRREARIQEEGRLQARENMGYGPDSEDRRNFRSHSQPPSLLDFETKNSSMFLTNKGKLKSEEFRDMNRRARGKKKNFDL